jgi:hypothetical protein
MGFGLAGVPDQNTAVRVRLLFTAILHPASKEERF